MENEQSVLNQLFISKEENICANILKILSL